MTVLDLSISVRAVPRSMKPLATRFGVAEYAVGCSIVLGPVLGDGVGSLELLGVVTSRAPVPACPVVREPSSATRGGPENAGERLRS